MRYPKNKKGIRRISSELLFMLLCTIVLVGCQGKGNQSLNNITDSNQVANATETSEEELDVDLSHLQRLKCTLYSQHVDCTYPSMTTKPLISGYVKYEITYELSLVDIGDNSDSNFNEQNSNFDNSESKTFSFAISIPDESSCLGVRDTVIKYALGNQLVGLGENDFENELIEELPPIANSWNGWMEWGEHCRFENDLDFYENLDGQGVLFLFNSEGFGVEITDRHYLFGLSQSGCISLKESDLVMPENVKKIHEISDHRHEANLLINDYPLEGFMCKFDERKKEEREVDEFYVCDKGFVYNYPDEDIAGWNETVTKDELERFLRPETSLYNFYFGKQYERIDTYRPFGHFVIKDTGGLNASYDLPDSECFSQSECNYINSLIGQKNRESLASVIDKSADSLFELYVKDVKDFGDDYDIDEFSFYGIERYINKSFTCFYDPMSKLFTINYSESAHEPDDGYNYSGSGWKVVCDLGKEIVLGLDDILCQKGMELISQYYLDYLQNYSEDDVEIVEWGGGLFPSLDYESDDDVWHSESYSYDGFSVSNDSFLLLIRYGGCMGERCGGGIIVDLSIPKQQIKKYMIKGTAVYNYLYGNSDDNLQFNANGVNFEMVHVEGESFTIGANYDDKDAREDEKPRHKVTIDDFYMGECEVTQELWKAIMGGQPTGDKKWDTEKGLGDNLPAYYVSWNECDQFISNLNKLLANQLNGRSFRMPTEAEWEYAARGGKYDSSKTYCGSNDLESVAWYTNNSNNQVHAVEQKYPNELGLYDMLGNVWEWCSDWYGDYTDKEQSNPKGPIKGTQRVFRGGSCNYDSRFCRMSRRSGFEPEKTPGFIGLRLVLQ